MWDKRLRDKIKEIFPPSDCLPEHVYHYTKIENLEKIIRSQVLWAMDRTSMKDRSDHTFGIDECLNAIDGWCPEDVDSCRELADEIKEKLGTYRRELANSPFNFSVSFTDKRDHARHWEEYGEVSIGFKTMDLTNHKNFYTTDAKIVAPNLLPSRVHYRGTQGKVINGIFDRGLEVSKNIGYEVESNMRPPIELVSRFIAFELDRISRQNLKSDCYSWESEWKWTPNVSSEEFVKSTDARNYIEMNFNPKSIVEVVLSSRAEFSKLHSYFRGVLDASGLNQVPILASLESKVVFRHGDGL